MVGKSRFRSEPASRTPEWPGFSPAGAEILEASDFLAYLAHGEHFFALDFINYIFIRRVDYRRDFAGFQVHDSNPVLRQANRPDFHQAWVLGGINSGGLIRICLQPNRPRVRAQTIP